MPEPTSAIPIDSETPSLDLVGSLREAVDHGLEAHFRGKSPDLMYAPIRYVFEGGGKRVRPVLLLLVARAYGADLDAAMPAALSVEVFHNFTLVHDDIMDSASERRGRPTVHVQWDEGTAILAGDLMLATAYQLLTSASSSASSADVRRVLDVYHPMVEKLCVGQRLDTHFETRHDVSVDDYLEMIDGKTAALLSASFELGAILGDAPPDDASALARAGQLVGRAFQIQDDLLDVTADNEDWGKVVGGDLQIGKRTYVTLRAVEAADGDEAEWFAQILDGGIPAEAVPEARERMRRLGVLDEARQAVEQYTNAAFTKLSVLPDSAATEAIHWLLRRLQARSH